MANPRPPPNIYKLKKGVLCISKSINGKKGKYSGLDIKNSFHLHDFMLSSMHHFVLSDFGNVSLSYIISLHCNIHNWNIFQSSDFFFAYTFCPTLHINIMASYRKLLLGVRNIVQTSQTRFSFQKLYGSTCRNFATTSLKNFPICTGIFELESFVTVTVNYM